jgi:DNA processing protein
MDGQIDPEKAEDPSASKTGGLGEAERRLFALIGSKPAGIDALIAASSLSPQVALNGLLVLELRGLIRQMPGKMFIRREK